MHPYIFIYRKQKLKNIYDSTMQALDQDEQASQDVMMHNELAAIDLEVDTEKLKNICESTMQALDKDEQALQDVMLHSELAAMDLELDTEIDENQTRTLSDKELETILENGTEDEPEE